MSGNGCNWLVWVVYVCVLPVIIIKLVFHHQTAELTFAHKKKCQRVVDARLTFCGETMATCVGTLCASMCVGHKVRHANITHLRGPKRLVLLLCGWMYRKWEESSKLSQFDGSVMGGEEWILRPTHHWRTSFKFS